MGYFQRGKKKKDEDADEEINDYFVKETDNEEKEGGGKKEGLLNKLKNKIKEHVEDIAENASGANKAGTPEPKASKKSGFLSLSKDVENE